MNLDFYCHCDIMSRDIFRIGCVIEVFPWSYSACRTVQHQKASFLARRILAVVLLDLLRVRICHEELVVETYAKSQNDSVGGSHGESLKRRHASVVSTDTRGRQTGHGTRPIQPLVVVHDTFW